MVAQITRWTGGRGDDLLYGGEGNKRFRTGIGGEAYGDAGNDSLTGGADWLMGGAGAERFVFDTVLRGGNIDNIADFAAVDAGLMLTHVDFLVI